MLCLDFGWIVQIVSIDDVTFGFLRIVQIVSTHGCCLDFKKGFNELCKLYVSIDVVLGFQTGWFLQIVSIDVVFGFR